MGYLWCQCPQVGYPEYPPYLFLVPAQVDGDFIAVVLGGGFRHAVEQEQGVAFPRQVVGLVDFPMTVELIIMPGIDPAAVRALRQGILGGERQGDPVKVSMTSAYSARSFSQWAMVQENCASQSINNTQIFSPVTAPPGRLNAA